MPLPTGHERSIITPSSVTHDFVSSHAMCNRNASNILHRNPNIKYPNWLKTFWTITVQQLDGTKTSIKLPDINRTPIYKLRELVKEALSIPTHQQKLTLGGGTVVVLEDWDEEGGAMAIAHYPSLHDGATLYLVQLTEGIRVNSQLSRFAEPPSCCPSTLPSTISLSPIPLPSYVNIHSPSKLSLNSLNKILRKFKSSSAYSDILCQSMTGMQFSPSDAPVASVEWIINGCTFRFTKRH